ncbi:MAG: c-type cytochrome [Pseudomonadota bacterium]
MGIGKRACEGVVLALLALPVAAAQDAPLTGQRKSAQCIACHGMAGISPNPHFPHLAGQQEGYLRLQLEAFRSGDRYHPLMTPVAQSLSDQEIDALAGYFSAIGPLAEVNPTPRRGQ